MSTNTTVARRSFLGGSGALVVGSAMGVLGPANTALADRQSSWRFCNKCFGMFYCEPFEGDLLGGQRGTCFGGGRHVAAGWTFLLPYNVPGSDTDQPDWRSCRKCFGIFFDGGDTGGRCPAGGAHQRAGFNFVLPHSKTLAEPAQNQWRFCLHCYALFWDREPNKGRCAIGGGHLSAGFDFVIPYIA